METPAIGKLIIKKNIANKENTSTGLYTSEFILNEILKISSTEINEPNNVEWSITISVNSTLGIICLNIKGI